MPRFVKVTLLASAVAVFAACGSDPTATSSASSGNGGGDSCAFTGTLAGGVVGPIQANGCATTSSAVFSIAQADITTGKSLGAKFDLVTPLKGGELGPIPLKSFEIFQREGKGMDQLVWSSTSCVLTLEKNEAAPTSVFENRFILGGRGSCPGPLEPTPPNARQAVTVSDFQISAFVNPR